MDLDYFNDDGPAREIEPPVDLLMPPGTVVTPPRIATSMHDDAVYEPAATGLDAPIPYQKLDRTPPALQHLEALTGDLLGLDVQWFVSLLGAVVDKGSVALFGEVRELGGADFRLYRVVSYDSGTGKFVHVSRIERAAAEHLYDQRVEELS